MRWSHGPDAILYHPNMGPVLSCEHQWLWFRVPCGSAPVWWQSPHRAAPLWLQGGRVPRLLDVGPPRKTLKGDSRGFRSYLLSFISELGDGGLHVCCALSHIGTTYWKEKVDRGLWIMAGGQPGRLHRGSSQHGEPPLPHRATVGGWSEVTQMESRCWAGRNRDSEEPSFWVCLSVLPSPGGLWFTGRLRSSRSGWGLILVGVSRTSRTLCRSYGSMIPPPCLPGSQEQPLLHWSPPRPRRSAHTPELTFLGEGLQCGAWHGGWDNLGPCGFAEERHPLKHFPAQVEQVFPPWLLWKVHWAVYAAPKEACLWSLARRNIRLAPPSREGGYQ